MIYEPTEATKVAKKVANAMEAFAEIIRNIENPEQGFEIKCVVPEDLALLAGMFAAVHSAPGRPSIVETWRGPGFYRVALRCGASQSQDFDKLDDIWVEVVKAEPEERLPVFDEADDDEWLHPEKEQKHYIVYATGPKGSIKRGPEGGLLLCETMTSLKNNTQVLDFGEMTTKEAANKCMMAYIQAVRMPEAGNDPVEVHMYTDKDGYAIAFTARWGDGSETIVCHSCE